MTAATITVAMVAGMPYPMTKASCIRVGHLVHNLATEHEDVRVEVFAYRSSEGPPEALRNVEYHLVEGFEADGARYYSWPNKIRVDLRLVGALIRRRRAIDVIHCHTIEGLGIALAFKALTLSQAPVCMDVHGPVVPEPSRQQPARLDFRKSSIEMISMASICDQAKHGKAFMPKATTRG